MYCFSHIHMENGVAQSYINRTIIRKHIQESSFILLGAFVSDIKWTSMTIMSCEANSVQGCRVLKSCNYLENTEIIASTQWIKTQIYNCPFYIHWKIFWNTNLIVDELKLNISKSHWLPKIQKLNWAHKNS